MHFSTLLSASLSLGLAIAADPTTASKPNITPAPSEDLDLQHHQLVDHSTVSGEDTRLPTLTDPRPSRTSVTTSTQLTSKCESAYTSMMQSIPSPTFHDEVVSWFVKADETKTWPEVTASPESDEFIKSACDFMYRVLTETPAATESVASLWRSDMSGYFNWAKSIAPEATKVAKVCLTEESYTQGAMDALLAVVTDAEGCVAAYKVKKSGIAVFDALEAKATQSAAGGKKGDDDKTTSGGVKIGGMGLAFVVAGVAVMMGM
ncbi:hypothetical protein QBC43DRAFT_306557 [Cladorrhinum sp. PSN259]|nr:hypothetical protein QBC43DRAFT_306557 [Cladorrhinum sp. PSN259]